MKAQISLFIILGFAILIAIGIAMLMFSSATEKKVERSTTAKQKITLQVQPIKDAITNCLKTTAKEAIILLGQQGGYLYREQGGPIENPTALEQGKTYIEKDGQKIRYLIDEPTGRIGDLFYTTPPEYPWKIFPYIDADYSFTQYNGYYGINRLPALYKPYSDSIQEQIETYISNNIAKCTQFENFKGLQITYAQPNTTLHIANDSIKITAEESTYLTLNWPVTIKEKTANATTMLTDFGAAVNIPLAKIYYNITTMLNQDSQDINYEPKSEGNYLATKIKAETDSIVFLKFINTRIDDQPYEFRFARHARHPALRLIKELKKELNLPNKPTFYDTIQLAKGAIITINGKQLQFSNYKCSENDAVEMPWEADSIEVTISDPDDEPNNENLQLKFKSPVAETDSRIKFTESTPPDKNAIEVKIIAQKTDTLASENKKEDSQTFWARVHECAPA